MRYVVTLILFLVVQHPAASMEKESRHFVFYYQQQDSAVIDTIASRLEGSFDRITGDLHLVVSSKVKVHIYPSLQEFHDAIGWSNAPDWLVGVADAEIYAVSPLNPGPAHSYKDMVENVFAHEFTHVCTNKVNGSLPQWLFEGFACYEAGPYYSKASVVSAYNGLGRIPTLDELSHDYNNFVNLHGYEFSLTAARFAIDTFGMDSMRQFINDPDNFSVFGGLSKSEFQQRWSDCVKEDYLGISSVRDYPNGPIKYGFELEQNYPNPFNPRTMIGYRLPSVCHIMLKVYDILGREIAILVDGVQSSGRHEVFFSGVGLPSGVYVCGITADGRTSTKKMYLLK